MKYMDKTLTQHAENRTFSLADIAKLCASVCAFYSFCGLTCSLVAARHSLPARATSGSPRPQSTQYSPIATIAKLPDLDIYVTPEGEAQIVHLGVMRPLGDERPEGAVV